MHQPEPPSRRVIQALGPTATTAVGADRISTGQATVSGSLKGDILYLRRSPSGTRHGHCHKH